MLRIRQQIQRIGGSLREVELKIGSSVRDEPLKATARDVLMKQRAKQRAARLIAGIDWLGAGTEDELVFTTRTGNPIEPRNLYRSFHRIIERNGIRRIRLHELRHTNGTTQKDLNVPAIDTQAIFGHSSLATTRIYQHVSLSHKRDALEKVEDHLFTQQFAEGEAGSRQRLPSSQQIYRRMISPISGGPTGIRTQDTRLKRPIWQTLNDRLASVDEVMRDRKRAWKLGCVAVKLAVKDSGLELAA
ncbi:tyrosine-type recombinase/integrase [Streptomyces sp. NPDC059631]|uniref:tyrosine-type recombinase/integrase n=1 Tax=Streptomyces sp. NPDC059631 TaxID=3346890 RepID=UPI0036935F8A